MLISTASARTSKAGAMVLRSMPRKRFRSTDSREVPGAVTFVPARVVAHMLRSLAAVRHMHISDDPDELRSITGLVAALSAT
jgi:hypothetical protein